MADDFIQWRRPQKPEDAPAEPPIVLQPAPDQAPPQPDLAGEPTMVSATSPNQPNDPLDLPGLTSSPEDQTVFTNQPADQGFQPVANQDQAANQQPINGFVEQRFESEPKKKRNILLPVSIIFLAIAILAAAAIVFFTLRDNSPAPAPTASANPSTSASPQVSTSEESSASSTASKTSASATASPSPSKTPSPSVDPEVKAKEQLDALVEADSARVGFDGRWVAMLASKAKGLQDPLDMPPSGADSWTYKDIYDQHMKFRQDQSYSSEVALTLSTRFGRATTTEAGDPYYVTLIYSQFGDAGDVRDWCDSTFSYLPEEYRNNSCAPAQLTPA